MKSYLIQVMLVTVTSTNILNFIQISSIFPALTLSRSTLYASLPTKGARLGKVGPVTLASSETIDFGTEIQLMYVSGRCGKIGPAHLTSDRRLNKT